MLQAAVQLLLAEITNESDDIANFCNHIVEKGITTPKGLLYIDDYMPSKHAGKFLFVNFLNRINI